MNETVLLIAGLILALASTSIIATRIIVKRRSSQLLRQRVEELIPLKPAAGVVEESLQSIIQANAAIEEEGETETKLRKLIALAGWHAQPQDLITISLCVGAGVGLLFAGIFQINLVVSLIFAALAAVVPFISLKMQANQAKEKLTSQLPNALDLMVSVLRSGHSIPQSLKAVANEVPHPCGREFNEVLQRVNLGQTLPEALSYTIARYESFELDLLRRAFQIHMEVGGSLAELLEKTNNTLRDRIKLKRHVAVLVAPSKLTAIIVALLPFIVAGATYLLAPSYMQPLLTTRIGNAMIAISLALQVLGVFIMRRMANFKV